MQQYFFWNRWTSNFRNFYYFLLALLVFSFGYYAYNYFYGEEMVFDWIVTNSLELFGIKVDSVRSGLLEIPIVANNYLITQAFQGTNIQISPTNAFIFLGLLVFPIMCLLAVVTFFKNYWYFVGITAFLLILMSFRLEQLILFDRTDKSALTIVLVLFVPLSYYFRSIKSEIGFFQRLAAFMLIAIGFGLIVHFFSGVEEPFLYLANYGIAAPVIITVIFIFIVSFQVIQAFLFLITDSNTEGSKSSLTHFLTVSIVYLLAVALAYFKNRQAIDWDLYFIDPFILLIISAIIGIWGFWKRADIFQHVLPFHPSGAILYASLAIICFTTIGYFFGTANDPIIETFEDTILMLHLGMGIGFFLYVLSNFLPLLKENLKVSRVVFKHRNMPFFTAQLAGFIIALALFLKTDQLVLNQAIAGYYNGVGDLAVREQSDFLAEQYYTYSGQYGFKNHHSNYALAGLAIKKKKRTEAIFYQAAVSKNPTPYAYANLGNVFLQKERFFDGLFALNNGVKDFPENGPLNNNLGLLYGKTKVVDSALYHFDIASHDLISRPVALANGVAISVKKGVYSQSDSAIQVQTEKPDLPLRSNQLVGLSSLGGKLSPKKRINFRDSLLNQNEFAYLYNATINGIGIPDTSVISAVDTSVSYTGNYLYHDALNYAKALKLYSIGKISQAYYLLDEMQYRIRSKAGDYNHLMGLWALENRKYQLAVDYFDKADSLGYKPARVHEALALAELGKHEQAKNILNDTAKAYQEIIAQNRAILDLIPSWNKIDWDTFSELTDDAKFNALHFSRRILSDAEIERGISMISNPYIKFRTFNGWVRHKQRIGDIEKAAEIIANNENTSIDKWTEIWQLYYEGKIEEASMRMNLSSSIISDDILYGNFIRAKYLEEEGDTMAAMKMYKKIALDNPFFEEGVIEGAAAWSDQNAFLAYDMLQKALRANPYSVNITKVFALQALVTGLDEYGEDARSSLANMVSRAEFEAFDKKYQALQQRLSLEKEQWD